MPTVNQSYAHCRRIARSRARNFFYSFMLLSGDRRDAMCALYAFMRYSDDIADDDSASLETRRQALGRWRSQVRLALDGQPCDDRVLPAFRHTVERYSIPHAYFFELLDGMDADLSGRVYRTFDELYRYCYQAASVVGMSTIHVFGHDTEAAIPLAEKCGVAFQLTNIMRDVSTDASMGRVYFPEGELQQFGLRRNELLDRSIPSFDARFQRFMEFQWRRADRYYRESAALLSMVVPASRPALWALVSIYHKLLVRIRKHGYGVLERHVRLSVWEKLWIVMRAFYLRARGGVPSFPA